MDFRKLFEPAEKVALKAGARALKGVWKPAWKHAAQKAFDFEKEFKEGTGPQWEKGHVRKGAVLGILHSTFDPYLARLPGGEFSKGAFWGAVEKGLTEHIAQLEAKLGDDWVSVIETGESHFAWPIEAIFDVDLDEDGIVGQPGTPGAHAAALILLGLLLASPGSVKALSRPHLHEHYVAPIASPAAPQPAEVENDGEFITPEEHHLVSTMVPPVDAPRRPPLVPHYQPSKEYLAGVAESKRAAEEAKADAPLIRGLGVETWAGHAPRRQGIDMGLGLVWRSGDWSAGGQVAVDRLGPCVSWKRVGANYLWNPKDGTRELGFFVPVLRY